jgi:type IV secretion system T-DNA border endonuclease VirD2
VASIRSLNDRAQEENGRFMALADAGLQEFRDRLQRSFAPYVDRFDEAGTSVAEMAARFTSRDRTEAQIEAWRPNEPAERMVWVQFERELQREAESIAATLPLGRALQEDLAREALLSSRPSDRLADIAALDKLVKEVRADLSDGNMDRIAKGQLDPLMDQIRDPGLRSAVGSELRNVAVVAEGQDITGRNSDPADQYRDLVVAHERSAARAREVRGRDSVDHGLDL